MSKKNSELKELLFIVVMLIGFGLSDGNGTSLLIGFLLVIGAVVGLVVLARRKNALPLDGDEREIWESIRAKGKLRYLLRSVMYGSFLGLLFLFYHLIKSLWTGESLNAETGFLLIALFVVLYIGASSIRAIKEWALYEERYKESLPERTQHNKLFKPTAS